MGLKFVFVCVFALTICSRELVKARSETTAGTSTTTASNTEALEDLICYANAKIIGICDQISSYIKNATETQEIHSLSEEISQLVNGARGTFPPLSGTMTQRIDQVAAMGPMFARCIEGKREKAFSIIAEGYSNLENCAREIRDLESGFREQMLEHSNSSSTLCESSRSAIASCAPNSDTAAAEECINGNVTTAKSSLQDKNNTVSEYVDSTLEQAHSIRNNVNRCVEMAQHHAFDLTGYFLSLITTCVDEVNRSTSTFSIPPTSTTTSSTP